jgi:hypothetical protein
LLAIICGGRCEGAAGWDSWPLDPNKVPSAARGDARNALLLADTLRFNVVDWLIALQDARALADRRDFRRLVVALAAELEARETLEQDDLIRIAIEAAREETTCST